MTTLGKKILHTVGSSITVHLLHKRRAKISGGSPRWRHRARRSGKLGRDAWVCVRKRIALRAARASTVRDCGETNGRVGSFRTGAGRTVKERDSMCAIVGGQLKR